MQQIQQKKSKQTDPEPSQSQHGIKSLKRSLTNKNRQICTLNRIITNLRYQLTEVEKRCNEKDEAIDILKKNNEDLKRIIKNKEIKQIQHMRKQQELMEKLFKANKQLQKKDELNQKQMKRQKSENQLKQNYLIQIQQKYLQLQHENYRLGTELELQSEAEHRIRQSRQSKFSDRQMSLQAFNYKNPRKRVYQNPFQGFLKPQYQQIFDQVSRFPHHSRQRGEDNTWCRIDELMSENFSPGTSTSRVNKSKLYTQQKFFKNKSEIDAESAIQMIRQENQRIKISLR